MCRLHVVPEPVDVDFFDPAGVDPLDLPMGQLVFGRARSEAQPVAFLSVSCCWTTSTCCRQDPMYFLCQAVIATGLSCLGVAPSSMLHCAFQAQLRHIAACQELAAATLLAHNHLAP